MRSPAFRYYMHEGPAAFSIELAGALGAEAAKRLEQDWRNASEVIGEKELLVDLSYVTEIDPSGRQLLLRWRRNGATLVANRPESRALIESIIGQPLPPIGRIAYTPTPYRAGWFFRDSTSDHWTAGNADHHERLSAVSSDRSNYNSSRDRAQAIRDTRTQGRRDHI